jgi:hypothetical protein
MKKTERKLKIDRKATLGDFPTPLGKDKDQLIKKLE